MRANSTVSYPKTNKNTYRLHLKMQPVRFLISQLPPQTRGRINMVVKRFSRRKF
jgi:hypothetical protein